MTTLDTSFADTVVSDIVGLQSAPLGAMPSDAATSVAVRTPKQNRSRASFEKLLLAAQDLLVERGYEGFTLADVVKASGVSIGSIYARVSSKDDLLRAVHERVMQDVEAEQAILVAPVRWEGDSLQDFLPVLLDGLAEMLRRRAPTLTPFMARATIDEIIGATGRASATKLAEGFEALLLTRREEINHPDPPRAAHACFTTAYSNFSRYLGLGSSLESAWEGDWLTLKADVALMCGCFLQFSADQLARHPRSGKMRIRRAAAQPPP